MWLHTELYKAYTIFRAKLEGRELALVDEGDPDGIVSGALFKIRYPKGIVVLAYPSQVRKHPLIRRVTWDFVADLPCPGKARLRADHHLTNPPCAEKEFYDPEAPAAAVMALKALGLENDGKAAELVRYAIETDTAKITSTEAMELEAAVKGADYKGRLYIIERLAERGIEALKDEKIKVFIDRFSKNKSRTEEVAKLLQPPPREAVLVFKEDMGLSYRYLTILLERAGSEFTFLLVPKGLFKYRVYAGANPDSRYSATNVTTPLGGGGHRYAAGASFRAVSLGKALRKVLPLLKKELGDKPIEVIFIEGGRISKAQM